MTIELKQVINAAECANEVYSAFYDAQTGKTVYLPNEIITGERDEILEELIKNSSSNGTINRNWFSTQLSQYVILTVQILPHATVY